MIALLMTEIFNFLSFGKKIEVSIIENFGNLKNKHIFSEDNEKKNYSFLLFTKQKKSFEESFEEFHKDYISLK